MRTRFPPSPTGFLHIGALRTALYNYLLARQTGGTFVLRIEDTDQARSVPGAVENIVEALRWAGLAPDEGVTVIDGVVSEKGPHGPYFQSARLPLYQKYADELVAKGVAYPCFCTSQRLDEMRKKQQELKRAPMYDRLCLNLSPEEIRAKLDANEPRVIRMKIPHERTITFQDDVRGAMTFQGHTVDDQVLVKSDGFPTYHLAHVVDDHLMEVDLVMRGEEWLSSLPKHLLLFEQLGWPVPRYAHLSLILNKDKSKLSKRQNAVSVADYAAKGYLPEALLNFMAMLGWNPGTTQELFSLQELIEQFSLERVQKAGAVFDLEKLDWLQGQWMRRIPSAEFAARIRPLVEEAHPAAKADPDFAGKAALIQERVTFFHEAPAMLGFFYAAPQVTAEMLASEKQKVKREDLPAYLAALIGTLENVPADAWNEERMLGDIKTLIAEKGWKLGQALWPMRMALTGIPYSPGAFEVAVALGRDESLRRLKAALPSL